MLVLLLTACDHEGALDDARARAADFLADHPVGTAIVHAPLASPGVEAVIGARWHGVDLAAWLAPCDPTQAFDATLRLEPGKFPWELLDDEGLSPCVTERLSTFPFEEPSQRDEVDIVVVRWRPAETAPAHAVDELEVVGYPAGLRALAPPYWRRSPSGDALEYGADLRLRDGRVRLRPVDADVVAGALEDPQAWARTLTCGSGKLDLVRVTLTFTDGRLGVVRTVPDTGCVEDRAREAAGWMRDRRVDGVRMKEAGRVLVVLDVPVGAW